MNANFKSSQPDQPKPLSMTLWNCDTLKWDRVYDVRMLGQNEARQYVPLIRRGIYDGYCANRKSPHEALVLTLAK